MRDCIRGFVRTFVLVSLGSAYVYANAGAYDTAAANGVAWLLAQRNVDDGSWGATDDVKFVQTSEAVRALSALNQLSPAYSAGLAWLENHNPANSDFLSRRILAMGGSGSKVSQDLTSLQGAQVTTGVWNNGWGLSSSYNGSALDTAIALQALNQQNVTSNVSIAVSFLTGSQLTGTDSGWAVDQETSSDPITTAQVIQALVPLKGTSSAVPTAITNALSALNAKVSSTSPVVQIAQTVLANLRNNSSSSQATTLLTALASQQQSNGSWGNDVYATSVSLRALAAGLAKDIATQQQTVNLPDAALRAAINANLGHGAMDAINQGQLQQLTSLSASGLGIKDLTGLQYATNLKTLDVSNNQISSFAPVAGLTGTAITETGNPGYVASNPADNIADSPTLPEWGAILMAIGLMMTMYRESNKNKQGPRTRQSAYR